MKLLVCVFLALSCSAFAEEGKKTEKRGVFGLGYGHGLGYGGYGHGLGYGGYGHGLGYAAIAPAPVSHISQVSYSAAHYAPVLAAQALAFSHGHGHGLGYAAAPAAIVAAPAVAKIGYAAAPYTGHGFGYAAPAYAAYAAAPAYGKIGLGYGYHH